MVAERVRDLARGPQTLPPFEGTDDDLLRVLDGVLQEEFDARRGGYGQRPKFPPHAELLYLLDGARRPDGAWRLAQARRTLEAMAAGGIHDQVGGGFHRYSTDGEWLLPHFEKMLYDNALLATAYARLSASTGEPRFAQVAQDVLAWARREMAIPGGGYASSLDADTDGEEGLTYTWTEQEVRRQLPPRDADLAIRLYGVTAGGNFRDEASGTRTGRNILHLPRPLETVAEDEGLEGPELAERIARIREGLLAARGRRQQPNLDDKVITAWNGLLLSAFAHVGRHLDDPRALEEGRALAAFLLDRCQTKEGALLRFPRGGGPEIPGFAEDHVHVVEGLLDLEEAGGEARWGHEAERLADRLLDGFEDAAAGGFFTTAADQHEPLLARRKESFDSPIPSDNGVAARALLRLGSREGGDRFLRAAERALAAWRPLLANERAARGTVALYRAIALGRALSPRTHGDDAPPDLRVESGGLTAALYLERDAVRPGGTVAVALRVEVPPGTHVNASDPAEPHLVPTALELPGDAPVRLGDVRYPEGEARVLAPGTGPLRVLEGVFWIRGHLEVRADAPDGPRRVPLRLRLQPCRGTACEPERVLDLGVGVRVAAADGPPRHAAVFPEDR
jgi:hypothetical protein